MPASGEEIKGAPAAVSNLRLQHLRQAMHWSRPVLPWTARYLLCSAAGNSPGDIGCLLGALAALSTM
jgi:hypothetical protein